MAGANIFKFFINTHPDSVFQKPFSIHSIFNERPYSIGFKSQKMKRIFDSGIQTMKKNGSYQQIVDNYLE